MAGSHDDTVASSVATLPGDAAEPADVGNRYRIVRWLGGGGMGRVYEVLDTELGERVALKVLRGGLSEEALERFRREVRLTRRIQHRNVARMFDIGEHNGDKFLTMELVDGQPMTHELGSLLPWARIQSFATQLCAGLGAAHAAGVVHRDLKPDNVMIERGTDRAVITDFGIARSGDDAGVTQLGVIIGTPRYMAPEQLAGSEVDARADIFSLGVMLYELASGERPWSGDNAIAIAVKQATQPMRPLVTHRVPPEYIEVVLQCLALERDQRPASAAQIGEAIAAAVHTPLDTGRVPKLTRPTPLPATLSPTHAPPTILNEETSIAVLPFQCAPADAYLAEGLVEELADILSTSAALRVRPCGHQRASDQDPREAGRALEVDHVVSGSLRRTPTGLRITVRLLGVVDGFQIWAHRADCVESEVLNVTDELGRGIAQALSTRAASANAPMAPAAVDYYLRARAELRRFWGEHAEEATLLLEQAAAIAPTSGPILSSLAYASVQSWIRNRQPAQLARAERHVERGLASGYGEAHLAASNLKLNRGELEAAARDLGFALARSPMSAQAHETTARLLIEIDAVPEGTRHIETAIGLDPGRALLLQAELARIDVFSGDWAAATARLDRLTSDPDPSVKHLGVVVALRLAMWRHDQAGMERGVEQLMSRLHGGVDLLGFYRTYVTAGTFDLSAWLHHLATTADPALPQRTQLAALQRYVETGLAMQLREAIEPALRTAIDYGLIDVVWMDRCPGFVHVREEPWFTPLRHVVAARAAHVLAAFRSAGG